MSKTITFSPLLHGRLKPGILHAHITIERLPTEALNYGTIGHDGAAYKIVKDLKEMPVADYTEVIISWQVHASPFSGTREFYAVVRNYDPAKAARPKATGISARNKCKESTTNKQSA